MSLYSVCMSVSFVKNDSNNIIYSSWWHALVSSLKKKEKILSF